MERTTREKEQFEQEHDRMKRKIESMSQSDNPAEEELRQECEELRVNSNYMAFQYVQAELLFSLIYICRHCLNVALATSDFDHIFYYAVCTHFVKNASIFALEHANVDVQVAVNRLEYRMFANFTFRYT